MKLRASWGSTLGLAMLSLAGVQCSAAGSKQADPGASGGAAVAGGANGAAGATSSAGNAGANATAGSAGSPGSAGNGPGAAGAGTAGTSSGSAGAGVSGSAGAGVSGSPGTAGSAGSAGTSGGGASPCSAPGLLFCDDFEARPLGSTFSAPWSTTFIGGTSTITIDDSVAAHSGTHSVRTHPTDDGYQTLLVYHDATVLPAASGRFYMRAQVRFGSAMTGGHNTFLMADLFAMPGAGMTTRVGEMNQMLMMTVGGDAHGYLSNQAYYQNNLPGVQFRAGSWECLEMMFDAPNTSFDVWVNGQEVPDLHVTDLAHENYDALRFGFEKYAGPVTDIWFDDIAIGSQQIGCN